MNIGMFPVNVAVRGIDNMIGLAQTAENSGSESIWTAEHAIVPVDYESKYPYDSSGKMGASPETNFVDPLIALSALAPQRKCSGSEQG